MLRTGLRAVGVLGGGRWHDAERMDAERNSGYDGEKKPSSSGGRGLLLFLVVSNRLLGAR